MQNKHEFPFVINVDSIAGGTVRECCEKAAEFSRHLRCMIRVEINDVKLTVCGAIMTGDDVYRQWEHYSK